MMGRPNSRSILSAVAIVLAAAVPTLITSTAHADPGDEAADTAPAAEPKADAQGDVEEATKREAKKKHAKHHAAKGAAQGDATAPTKAKGHGKSSGKTASAAPAADKPHAAKAKKGKKTASRGPSKKKTEKKGDAKAPERRTVASREVGGGGRAAPCAGPISAIDRAGREGESLALVDCEGVAREEAVVRLSVLARREGATRPHRTPKKLPKASAHAAAGGPVFVAKGARALDPGLVVRLDAVARKFPGKAISVVSGYRSDDNGSLHHEGKALDVRVADVSNAELVELCKTLPDTGCGFYPNATFVHFDVRPAGAGAVSWIDASGPGEAPRYVTSWPPADAGSGAGKDDAAPGAGGAAGAHGDIDAAAARLDATLPEPTAPAVKTTRAAAGPAPVRKR